MRPVDRDAFLRPHIGTAAGAGELDTGRRSPMPRPGWYAYRVTGRAELPSWAVEVALTIERPVGSGSRGPGVPASSSRGDAPVDPSALEPDLAPWRGPARAMVLLRAPGRLPWLDGIAEAIAEVETVAGICPADPEDDLVEGTGGRRGRLLRPPLPGLIPVRAAVARDTCGRRIPGLPAPLRRGGRIRQLGDWPGGPVPGAS